MMVSLRMDAGDGDGDRTTREAEHELQQGKSPVRVARLGMISMHELNLQRTRPIASGGGLVGQKANISDSGYHVTRYCHVAR